MKFAEITSLCRAACQRWPMQDLPVVIESIGDDNYQAAIRFLAG